MCKLHPEGLKCPVGHPLPPGQAPHKREREPIVDYKCRICGKVSNLFTGTGTHYDCATILMVMRGFVQSIPTLHLANELSLDYGMLLERHHRTQHLAFEHHPTDPLPDEETEGDGMFQNAGEKGTPHPHPDDPARRRANKHQGVGTKGNDRPPISGIVGRTSGQIRLRACDDTQQTTIQPQVEADTKPTTTFNTDESSAYNHIAETGRGHATVCHSRGEWARDANGDGIREVYCNIARQSRNQTRATNCITQMTRMDESARIDSRINAISTLLPGFPDPFRVETGSRVRGP